MYTRRCSHQPNFCQHKNFSFSLQIKGSSLLCNEWALIWCSRKPADTSFSVHQYVLTMYRNTLLLTCEHITYIKTYSVTSYTSFTQIGFTLMSGHFRFQTIFKTPFFFLKMLAKNHKIENAKWMPTQWDAGTAHTLFSKRIGESLWDPVFEKRRG